MALRMRDKRVFMWIFFRKMQFFVTDNSHKSGLILTDSAWQTNGAKYSQSEVRYYFQPNLM